MALTRWGKFKSRTQQLLGQKQKPVKHQKSALDEINDPTETPQFYDGFVCYNHDETDDLEFVTELIEKMEGPHKIKLFVPGRDDLPGATENVTDTDYADLIEKRCRRVVLIISKSFLRSPACDFQTKFALSLSPGAKSRKLIPLILDKDCIEKIEILQHIALMDFTRDELKDWAWQRLAVSLKSPID